MAVSPIRHPSVITRIRNLERIREISEVAIRHGFGYFFERHRLFGVMRVRRRRAQTPPAHLGRHLREMLDELGPTFVKFGQLLSTRPDIVPPDIVQELVKLQDRVSPFPFDVVKQVIQEDFGLTLERAFESFDAEPLAAASIGQVHTAVLPGGGKVVVKVQRPGASRQIRKDLDLLLQVAELVEGRIEFGFSPLSVVREFARSINRELDYILEARNADRFLSNFRTHEAVRIPRVYWRYTSTRVLTLERLEGPTLNSVLESDFPLEERRRLAETIASCWFKQIMEDGFFHADPHPANVVYLGDGKIGLLDFGMAGFLSADDLEESARLFLYVMHSDIPGIKRSLKRLGVHWPPSADETVTQSIEEGFSRYFGMSLATVDFSTVLHQVFDLIYSLRLRLPSRFLLLDKTLLTLEGVVTQLYPDLNMFEVARGYTGEVQRRRYDPRVMQDRARRGAAEFAEILYEFPRQVHHLLEEMRSGELEIKYRHTGLENVMHRLDVITNRLVVALVSIALGSTSTAVAILIKGGPHVAGLSVWGLPGFVGALFFGAWLIYAIIRSGRL